MSDVSMSDVRRDGFVDEIRGLALLGIVLVNVPFLALSETGYTAASLATAGDRLAAFVTVAFAQAKFYLLFSFLFGYSLSYLLRDDAAERRARFRRRLLALGLLGAAHAVFAFVGDILVLYAVVGISMLWLVRWSDRALLRFGGALLLGWLALLGGLAASLDLWLPDVNAASGGGLGGGLDAALSDAGFAQASLARLRTWPEALLSIAVLNGPAVWAMFAFGTVAGRRRLLAEPERHLRFWRRAALLGTVIGLPLALWSAWLSVGDGQTPLHSAQAMRGVLLGFAGAPALSLAYVALLALAQHRWPGIWAWARAPGRMSLSAYIGESILLSLLFCAYGVGWFGQVGAAFAMLCAVAVWALLDVFARLWLARFRRGPLEALLDRLIRTAPPASR